MILFNASQLELDDARDLLSKDETNYDSDGDDSLEELFDNDNNIDDDVEPLLPINLVLDTQNGSTINVKQDIIHLFIRLSKVLLKSHGASASFRYRLSDCFFQVDKEDFNTVCDYLRSCNRTELDIKNMIKYNWDFFLKYCRRIVPQKDVLIRRFDRVCNFHANILDATTGKPFFNRKAHNDVKNIRGHILKDCVSDPVDFPMYFKIGKHRTTALSRFRCCRGTNSTEGYHKHFRKIVASGPASPKTVNALLIGFNFHWNNSMDVRNRGMPDYVAQIGDLF